MKIVEVDNIQSAMKMLETGHIKYFIGAQSEIADDIKARSVDTRDFEQAFVMHLWLYMAFANPRDIAVYLGRGDGNLPQVSYVQGHL